VTAVAVPALQVADLSFAYGAQPLLSLPSLDLPAGSSCALIGPSGCGKTTLLHLIAGLLPPQRGRIVVAGKALTELGGAALDRFRGRHIGIVFQRLHLLPALTVLENLQLAQRFAGVQRDAAAARALLDALAIGALAPVRPATLSQGQAQRVAIARALVHRPRLLLADEPTSNLDDDNARRALDLLCEQAWAIGAALLLVTHDHRVRGRLERELVLGAVQ
jgi:ABC-type lipoprotein export system ATPase subunit